MRSLFRAARPPGAQARLHSGKGRFSILSGRIAASCL